MFTLDRSKLADKSDADKCPECQSGYVYCFQRISTPTEIYFSCRCVVLLTRAIRDGEVSPGPYNMRSIPNPTTLHGAEKKCGR